MHVCFLELGESDEMQVMVGDLPPLRGTEPCHAPQTEHDIPEDV
jgi:hypothetical protein